jgi:hypothetical protein
MRGLAMLALVAVPGMVSAQTALPGGNAQGDVALTIYSDGTTLVQDTRQLNLPSGITRQEFRDVSENIRPETVRLSADAVEIVEQNFDYDLLSPAALMQKAVGQTITIVRTNPGTGAETREQARVLAANNGVVLDIGGRIEVLRDDGLPVRVIYPSLPPNLRARPTLSVTLDSARAGARPVTLSYLSSGLGWRADYVALFDEAKGAIDVQGWITLNNSGDTAFPDADIVMVAGVPATVGQQPRPGIRRPMPVRPQPGGLVQAGTETAGRARLGDFYLYPIARPTTVAANQQKQVSFLNVSAVPARRGYQFRSNWLQSQDEPTSASTVLNFSSSRSGGLGDALPAGTVRVYVRDAQGQPQFIGENNIGHTPMGSALSIRTGDAFDVRVRPVVENRERLSANRWRTTQRYTLTNARSEPVTVELVQDGLNWAWTDTRVVSETIEGERRGADQRVWQVPVPANGEAVLSVVTETRY